jgi:hypothetical protein
VEHISTSERSSAHVVAVVSQVPSYSAMKLELVLPLDNVKEASDFTCVEYGGIVNESGQTGVFAQFERTEL